jgi:hypothetical protein
MEPAWERKDEDDVHVVFTWYSKTGSSDHCLIWCGDSEEESSCVPDENIDKYLVCSLCVILALYMQVS